MAIYRVIVNGKTTGQTVTAASEAAAYADVPGLSAYTAGDTVQLQEVDDPDISTVGFMMVELPSESKDPIFPIR
jgi:hypothetical protein